MSKTAPQTLALTTDQEEQFKKNLKHLKSKVSSGMTPGVVYVGHIPHGFYEEQMQKFFCQFGEINRLRISRSKTTGGCKGYGFVEFECDEVAKIVADTMNNYLMFRKLLKCEFMAPERVHKNTFLGADKPFKVSRSREISIAQYNKPQSLAQKKKAITKMDKKNKKKLSKLSSMGIEYSFDGFKDELDKVTGGETELNNTSIEDVKKTYHVLFDDTSEEEIEFKTPPGTVRSSKIKGSQPKRKSTINVDPDAATPEHTPKVPKLIKTSSDSETAESDNDNSVVKDAKKVKAKKDIVTVPAKAQTRKVLPRKAKLQSRKSVLKSTK